ncbi:MAG: 23S rRNA (guanosine(2251)-2'-O)-methyltransferase RlmB [Desulfobacca sp. 4484_104]|nr:MAG: 23S rRNA (guanosine(2251)-2'-O)-methyltransferase RlmB [Desulfobacca sp. 4484_104]
MANSWGRSLMSEIIYGVHPVLAALRQRGNTLEEVIVAKGAAGQWLEEVRRLARQHQVRFRVSERAGLDRLCQTSRHQGIMARVAAYRYLPEAELLDRIAVQPKSALVVVADCLQDPMNLGNLMRSAHAVGAQGLVIPKHRAVGVTPAVAKAAAGAAAYLPVARVTNLSNFLKDCKAQGLWVVGAEAQAVQSLYTADLTGPLTLVIGGEGSGIRPRVRRECDLLLAIPMATPQLGSLNAAVAGAIFMFEILRQRQQQSPQF